MNDARLRQLTDLHNRLEDARMQLRVLHGDILPINFERTYGCSTETAAEILKLLRNDLTMQVAHLKQEFEAA